MTIFSAAIYFLGYWNKVRFESKKKNKLNLSESITKFELPRNDTFGHETISVSYNSRSYDNLVHYYATAENIGLTSIQGQNIFLELPADIIVVSKKATTSSKAIGLSESASADGEGVNYVIDRLEPGESISISFLADTCLSEQIKARPRGVENAEYSNDKRQLLGGSDDIQPAIMLLGAFIATGSVPAFGVFLQAILLMVGSPIISRAIRSVMASKRQVGGSGSPLDSESGKLCQVVSSVGEVKAEYVKH